MNASTAERVRQCSQGQHKAVSQHPLCYASKEDVLLHLGDGLENIAHLLHISINLKFSSLSHILAVVLLSIFQRDIVWDICRLLVRLFKALDCPATFATLPNI